jgi:hypothetical protein
VAGSSTDEGCRRSAAGAEEGRLRRVVPLLGIPDKLIRIDSPVGHEMNCGACHWRTPQFLLLSAGNLLLLVDLGAYAHLFSQAFQLASDVVQRPQI